MRVQPIVAAALLSACLAGTARAEADLCSAKVLLPVGAVEDSSSLLAQGSTLDGVTQFNVEKQTGRREFCVHGGFCYPETVTLNGKPAKSLKLTNCRIGKVVNEDSETQYWSLDVVRASVNKIKLRYADVDGKLSAMGMCNACADNATQFYLHKPESQCGQLVKSALEGNPDATKELAGNPDYCNWTY